MPEAEETAPESEASTYTLEELDKRCGDITKEKVLVFVARHDKAALVKMGTEVRTSRITTDSVRIYGISLDFLEQATPEDKKAVRGISLTVVKGAIKAMIHGEQLYEELTGSKSKKKDKQEELITAAIQLREAVLSDREVAIKAISGLTGGDPVWNTRIKNAEGSIATPKSLVKSVKDLATVATELLEDTSPDLVELRETLEVEKDDWLAELEQLQKNAVAFEEAATKATAAKRAPKVSQADVDYWDGVNLVLLSHIIDVHEAGHRKSPNVPRLVPITLRKWFGTSARKPKATETPSA